MADPCTVRTGLVYVGNPNSPTGTVVRGDESRKPPKNTSLGTGRITLIDDVWPYAPVSRAYRRFPLSRTATSSGRGLS
jgi:hypothetical protein